MRTRFPILIGTLNRKLPLFAEASCAGPGLASGWFDTENLSLEIADEENHIDNPSFLRAHPTLPFVFATSEVHDWHEGVISSIQVDPRDLKLTYRNKQAALGSCTAHCSVDGSGGYLLVTNFMIGNRPVQPGMGVVSFAIREDGSLGAPVSALKFSGSGPVEGRQDRSHPHCIFTTPDNRHVIVADLGTDSMLTIPFDETTGLLDETSISRCAVPAGSGPRHFIRHPRAPHIYLINEVSGTIDWFDVKPDGELSLRGTLSAREDGAKGRNDSSDLQITSDGRYLYAANRGDDTIAQFRIGPNGEPVLSGHIHAHGRCPRNLAITPDDRLLLVSNQYSDNIAAFTIEPESGVLVHRKNIEFGSPMSVVFPTWAGLTPA
ncbi:lactonase family protein [Rhizobium grahamii]|uniref:Lactonase family protein n=2 Tax=Rhizobium TaxID=379 RepID=A0A5Q0C9W8_9HYPH|nr:lactonase family protein [Rhizobium grahamii]